MWKFRTKVNPTQVRDLLGPPDKLSSKGTYYLTVTQLEIPGCHGSCVFSASPRYLPHILNAFRRQIDRYIPVMQILTVRSLISRNENRRRQKERLYSSGKIWENASPHSHMRWRGPRLLPLRYSDTKASVQLWSWPCCTTLLCCGIFSFATGPPFHSLFLLLAGNLHFARFQVEIVPEHAKNLNYLVQCHSSIATSLQK